MRVVFFDWGHPPLGEGGGGCSGSSANDGHVGGDLLGHGQAVAWAAVLFRE
jgi:hypothetical protein